MTLIEDACSLKGAKGLGKTWLHKFRLMPIIIGPVWSRLVSKRMQQAKISFSGMKLSFLNLFLVSSMMQLCRFYWGAPWPSQGMFVERSVNSSALFTFLVGWHASAVSLPPGDVIFAQLVCPLDDIIFLYTLGITNLYLYKHLARPCMLGSACHALCVGPCMAWGWNRLAYYATP